MFYFEFLIIILLCAIIIYLHKIFITLKGGLYFNKQTIKVNNVKNELHPYLSYIRKFDEDIPLNR